MPVNTMCILRKNILEKIFKNENLIGKGKEDGIDLNDCEKVNNEINDLLDKADYIKEQYFLEVSSTGVERVLRKDKHLQQNRGNEINIKLFKKDEKGKDIIDEDKQQIINAQNIIYRLFEPSPNNKLEAISLRGNYLGNKIISHIFDLLKNNTTLRVLNIYKNNFTS